MECWQVSRFTVAVSISPPLCQGDCVYSTIFTLTPDVAPWPPASPEVECVYGLANVTVVLVVAVSVVVGVQILFIETDDLRDRPEEIMPMVHRHIGEMTNKAFAWSDVNV